MKADPTEVRDELIIYCQARCPESAFDYDCPDHSCIVWKLLDICNTESNK
jgi:hypothetical protein